MRSALKLEEPNVYKRSTAAAWVGIEASLEAVSHKYVRTLGANGYGLLNALTDFATNPLQNHIVRRDRHSFQSLAGKWLSRFTAECKKESFDAERYVVVTIRLRMPGLRSKSANGVRVRLREHGQAPARPLTAPTNRRPDSAPEASCASTASIPTRAPRSFT